ncbi:MAG TPA: hypothetical protein VHB47_05155, partial [Thermoanaerobaculia bacterium]|nr:hypothetical protein [Thermoanaerobaculia bacterium]
MRKALLLLLFAGQAAVANAAFAAVTPLAAGPAVQPAATADPVAPPAGGTPAAPPAAAGSAASGARLLTADTPLSTVTGNTFVAPAGWSVSVRGPATILEAPEHDSWIALVDVMAKEADAAVAAAWAAYKPEAKWPLKVVHDQADRFGWT